MEWQSSWCQAVLVKFPGFRRLPYSCTSHSTQYPSMPLQATSYQASPHITTARLCHRVARTRLLVSVSDPPPRARVWYRGFLCTVFWAIMMAQTLKWIVEGREPVLGNHRAAAYTQITVYSTYQNEQLTHTQECIPSACKNTITDSQIALFQYIVHHAT